MTAFLAGIAPTRCMEHPRAAEIDGTARAVLAAMAWPATEQNPRCFAAHASIARRSGFDRRTVIRAQERLAELGVIERVPTGPGLPAEWRLVLLRDSAKGAPTGAEGVSESHTPPPPDLCQNVTPPVSESHTPYDSLTPNPSDLSRPPGREKRGRSDAADAAPSAGATGSAAAPSTEQSASGLVAEVMADKGYSQSAAEAYIAHKRAGSSAPVRNETAFIRACLKQDAATPNAPSAKGKGSAKAAKAPRGAGQAKRATTPGVKRPAHVVRKAQVAEAVAASRAGESDDLLAERLHVTLAAVDRCRVEHDGADARAAVLAGESPEEAAARFPRGWDADGLRGWLQRHHEREQRRADAEALRAQRLRDDEQRQAASDALRREWDEHFAAFARSEKTEQWA